MSGNRPSVPTGHFDALYGKSSDPWGFETSAYERRKYDLTLASLPDRRFGQAFELGCSIGVLTVALAERCDRILAGDCSAPAIEIARTKRGHHPNVTFRQMRAPGQLPSGSYDLIVLSEVLYFLAPDDLGAVAAFARNSLAADGIICVVNYLGETDAALSGEAAAEAFLAAAADWTLVQTAYRETDFRIDILRRAPSESRS